MLFLGLLGGAGTLLGVDRLDVLTLGQGTLVGSQASLGVLVNSLVSTRSTRLDHIEDTTLVGRKAGDFTDQTTDHGRLGSNFLEI
jgi:hypothetical protein